MSIGLRRCYGSGILAICLASGFVNSNSNAAQVNVVTQRYDNSRTGGNTSETLLNTSNVNVNQFGKLITRAVDGQIYAQPLYVSSLTLPGSGTHNVVFVATEHNSVYAFDADNPATTAPFWQVNLGLSVPSSDISTNCVDLTPEIGITATPVIDLSTNTMYLTSKTKDSSGNHFNKLHALDITTGSEKFGGPVTITATVNGTGAGNVSGKITFNPLYQFNRPGLLMLNGVIYIGFGSHCDVGPYHGWLFGYDAVTLQQTSVFNLSPNGSAGSPWQSGNGLAADSNGNIYIMTGNGSFDVNTGGVDYGSSFIKFSTTNRVLSVASSFTPGNVSALNSNDLDVGAGGPLLIPGTNLLVGDGKAGMIYLLNRDSLGGFNATTDQVVQEFTGTVQASGNNPTAAYWQSPTGKYVYYWTFGDVLKAFLFNGSTFQTAPASQNNVTQTSRAGGISISANGSTAGSGVLWATTGLNGGTLYAYDASDVSRQLWNSGQNASRDGLGNYVKFTPPVVANGKVYAASSSALVVYGLFNPPTSVNVALTSPANGTTFTAPADIPLQATASDSNPAVNVTSVQFFANGTPIGNGSISGNGSWSFLWTGVAMGNYTLTVQATDANGNTGMSSPIQISVPNANTVWQSYNVVAQAGTFQAAVTDQTGAVTAEVDLYESVNIGGVDFAGAFTTYNAGPHPDAYNNVENYWANGTGAVYPYAGKSTVNRGSGAGESNTPPPLGVRDLQLFPDSNGTFGVASFVAPLNGIYLVSNLAVRRVDTRGNTARLKVFNSNKAMIDNIQATNNQAWVVDPNTFSLGQLSIGSKIYFAVDPDPDNSFDATEIAWTIRCDQAPQVSIVSPINNATFTAPASITINAQVTDPDDSSVSVSFFSNGALLKAVNSSPYSLTLTNIAAGNYSLTAVATDARGAQSTSAAVNISVSPGNGAPYGQDTRSPVSAYLNMPNQSNGTLPTLLSQTGAFSNVSTLTPATGLIPYNVITPLWSDGAIKTRWMAMPNSGSPYTADQQVGFAQTGDWAFPNGTVFVKHFELGTDDTNPTIRRRLETRLLVRSADGYVYGATYKWRSDNSDADLLTGSLSENITITTATGTRTQTWYYPSQSDCITCHTQVSGGVLGVKTRQLDTNFSYPSGVTDNQLRTWNHLGLLNPAVNEPDITTYSHLVAVTDTTASLQDRARSYIDANCQHCHRPGGVHANFDARWDTPLASQNIINGPVNSTLGIDGAAVVVPQDVWRSILYDRVNTTDSTIKMPILARNVIDTNAVSAIQSWINSLPGTPAEPPPTIVPSGGTFNNSVTVSMSDSDPNAAIHYTLDGTLPTAASPLYSNPITLQSTATVRASAFQTGFNNSASTTANFTVNQGLPTPWIDQDVGTVGVAGSAQFTSGTFTVNGSGVDIWNTADSFNFAYQSMIGDGQITARVASVQNTDPWAKAGVMIRQSITAGSVHACMCVTSGNGTAFQRRTVTGGSSTHTAGATVTAPYWVRLVRSGSTFTGYQSSDGVNWSMVGSDTVSMSGTVYIGMAVTAHNNTVLNTSTFNNVALQITPADIPPQITLTSPLSGATFAAPANISVQATASDSDGTVSKVDYYQGSTLIGTVVSAPFTFNWNNVGTGTYALSAVATDNGGMTTRSGVVNITVSTGGALPSPWTDADVGAVGVTGSATFSNNTFTVNASGVDVWNTADSFHFVLQPFSGDGQIVARIVGVQNTDPWAKAGVMFRQNLNAGSVHAFMAITSANGAVFQRRTAAGGASTSNSGSAVSAPYWVKLVKNGSTFTGYQSSDGSTWVQVASDTISMSGSYYMGLALTAHNNTVLNTSVFSNVSVQSSSSTDFPPTVGITSPPNNASFAAPANIPITATASDTDGTVTRVDFYNGSALLGSASMSPYTYNWNNVAAGNYSLTAVATDNAGLTTTSSAVVITVNSGSSALPPPWTDQDIGSVGVAGSATFSNGVFTVKGSGTDIWNTADGFNFVYQPISSDAQIVARVASIQNTDPWAKAGVMIRESLTAASTQAMMCITSGNGAAFQRRLTTGGSSVHTVGALVSAPYWVKLVRSGSTFTGYQSVDGANWVMVGSDTIAMSGTFYVGLAVTSHNNSVLNTSMFDNVALQVVSAGDVPPTVAMTAPANGQSFASPAMITISANASDSDGTVAKVDFYNGTALIDTATAAPYSFNWTNVAAGVYTLSAIATDNGGATSTSNAVRVTVNSGGALPGPWADQDIGAVGLTGSASFASSTFTVKASGLDIWNTADSFHFVYQPLSANGHIIARVVNVQNTDPWAKAGVMIRQSPTDTSVHAMMCITSGNGAAFQRRLTTGGISTHTAGSLVTAPYWVKLVRSGNTFTGYQSADGVNWVQVGTDTITMSGTVYIGLCLCSHNNAALNTSMLDNVSVQVTP